MRKLFLIAGAAALAASMPAVAEKGGKGGGHGGGGKAAHAQGHGGRGKPQKMSGGGGFKAPKPDRQVARGGGGGNGGGGFKSPKAERQVARGGGKAPKVDRQAWREAKPAKAERQALRRIERGQQRLERVSDRSSGLPDIRVLRGDAPSFAGGGVSCPPGLSKKGNGCLPPGQAKKAFGVGDRVQQAWFGGYNVPSRYSPFYHDTADSYYRYDDEGYIYRVDSDSGLISGLIPLLGGGFAVGQPLPSGYDVYNVPLQYRDVYYDTDDYSYRYGDDAIYRVDAESGIIESIVALLAGDLNVGQPLPSGYDAYNVPLNYRDEYYDTDEHMYRYADGNIYQVDAQTQIIQAIVEMLV